MENGLTFGERTILTRQAMQDVPCVIWFQRDLWGRTANGAVQKWIRKVGEVGMINWDKSYFAQQGWQCPIYGAVYSPFTMGCMNCTGWKTTNKTDTKSEIDWVHHDSVTKTEKTQEGR